jgi:hypothetical protein
LWEENLLGGYIGSPMGADLGVLNGNPHMKKPASHTPHFIGYKLSFNKLKATATLQIPGDQRVCVYCVTGTVHKGLRVCGARTQGLRRAGQELCHQATAPAQKPIFFFCFW